MAGTSVSDSSRSVAHAEKKENKTKKKLWSPICGIKFFHFQKETNWSLQTDIESLRQS